MRCGGYVLFVRGKYRPTGEQPNRADRLDNSCVDLHKLTHETQAIAFILLAISLSLPAQKHYDE